MFDRALSGKHGENIKAEDEYAKLSDAEADRIQTSTGLDVRGWIHFISADEIRHAWNRHGPDSYDPIPLTKADFELIHDVIVHADRITYPGLTDTGLPAILYEKRVNGHLVVVEEKRGKKGKRLAFKTMYKQKAD